MFASLKKKIEEKPQPQAQDVPREEEKVRLVVDGH